VELQRTDDGASLRVDVSQPARAHVDVVRDEDGTLRRIHVDLPPGTVVAPGVLHPGLAEPPVVAVRVGRTGADAVRIVLDLDGARDYHVERRRGATTIVLAIAAAPTTADASDVAPPPPAREDPPPDHATPVHRRTRPRIVIDPGHGGDDPGAEGFAVEKQVTLDLARRLRALLRQRLHAEVVLTREDDSTLALKERTARANAEDADLFVSIHANANPTGRLRGIETYYLDNSTDHATLRLAKMENGLDLLRPRAGEASLRYILSDLVQVGKVGESARLARSIQRGLVDGLRRRYGRVVDLGVKRGPFYVLVGAYMPCVLVETAFLTHPVEGPRLARPEYRQDVALGLYDGIARYLADGARRRTL
jgi:N-acetylmuramoyl-L-alanine amidase